ncbi:MAG: succinate dehydrogenase assembly factor 2 [Gammaproteobacteria bacterium]
MNDAAPVTEQPSHDPERARIEWACRRGLLELDLLFKSFMAHGYDDLNAKQRSAFERLLKLPDQELLGWMMGYSSPNDTEWVDVVARVRGTSQMRA